jgi:hypothetical protein
MSASGVPVAVERLDIYQLLGGEYRHLGNGMSNMAVANMWSYRWRQANSASTWVSSRGRRPAGTSAHAPLPSSPGTAGSWGLRTRPAVRH